MGPSVGIGTAVNVAACVRVLPTPRWFTSRQTITSSSSGGSGPINPSGNVSGSDELFFPGPSTFPISHGEHDPHHVDCHPIGTTCQYCMILHQFQESSWRRMHEMEPRDPTTGRSVLLALLMDFADPKGGRIYGCRICTETFARAGRAITHLRHKHLDHRPFACQGRCRVPDW